MAAMAAAAALVLVAAVAIGTTSSSDGDSAAAGAPSTANPNTAGGPEAEADTDDVNAVDPTTDTTDQAVTTEVEVLSATTAPPSADTPERLAATDVDASVRHGRYSDGKITLLGPVRDVATADRLVAAAGEVIGAENVINEYVIDPTAPETTDGLVIVDDPVLFAAGSAELNSDFFPLLDLGKIVLTLNEQATLRIVGHTDSLGDPANNQALSEARARAVADYIVAGGIAEDRLEVIGAGSAEPRESNDTAVGRAANRRIDVQILNLIS